MMLKIIQVIDLKIKWATSTSRLFLRIKIPRKRVLRSSEKKIIIHHISVQLSMMRELGTNIDVWTYTVHKIAMIRQPTNKDVVLPLTDPKMWKNWVSFFFFFKRKEGKKVTFCGNNLVLNPYLIFKYNKWHFVSPF